MGILPSCNRVNDTIKLHHYDSNETLREKNKMANYTWKLRAEQILEAAPHQKKEDRNLPPIW